MTEPTLTPARLWKRMPAEQRVKVARAFWLDADAANDQVQAVMLIAQHKKFRPKTVVSLDVDRKARHLASLPSVPEAIATRALVDYHLLDQRPMMGAFLDALGIPHEEGLIKEDEAKPDTSKIPAAVEAITKAYPAEDVSLYLSTLLCQDPGTWGALSDVTPLQA